MTADIRSAPLRLLDVEFNPRVRSLDAGGQRAVLDSRSCSVFAALAEQLGDCVSKEDLLRVAWPDQLVHENSLAKAISKLRRAIRGSQLEIVAAYGVGYILRPAGADHALAAGNAPPAGSPESPARPLRSRYSLATAVAVSLLAILSAAAGIMAFASSQRAVAFRSTPPITHDAPNARATILWVDDHPANNKLEIAAFKRQQIAVHLAETTEDALKLVAMNRYRLVISDLGRGEDRLAGLKMIEALKQRGTPVPVVIYTMRPDDRAGQEAQRQMVADAGAADLAVTPQEVRSKVLKRLAPPS
jgi:DNA-binding response OmpR family regulator